MKETKITVDKVENGYVVIFSKQEPDGYSGRTPFGGSHTVSRTFVCKDAAEVFERIRQEFCL